MNANTSALYVEHQYEHIALKALSAVLVVLLCGYLYFVCASALNAISRKEAAVAEGRATSRIADLESQYLALSQQVTLAQGERLGLTPIAHTDYVNREAQTHEAKAAETI